MYNNISNGTIILRGDTFRNSENTPLQFEAYQKMIVHMIKPLTKLNIKINIIIATYEHPLNHKIKEIFNDYEYELVNIERTKSQTTNFIIMMNKLKDKIIGKDFVLISRNDLYFIDDINYTRIHKNKILFQWNLLLEQKNNFMSDQIHFIGGNLLKDFIYKINLCKLHAKWPGSLHYMYNICIQRYGKNQISYLNYIENPNPGDDICQIRGNPDVMLGNPLYKYIKTM